MLSISAHILAVVVIVGRPRDKPTTHFDSKEIRFYNEVVLGLAPGEVSDVNQRSCKCIRPVATRGRQVSLLIQDCGVEMPSLSQRRAAHSFIRWNPPPHQCVATTHRIYTEIRTV
jgi:hypothetical protein